VSDIIPTIKMLFWVIAVACATLALFKLSGIFVVRAGVIELAAVAIAFAQVSGAVPNVKAR
jgi:hypothetical protein